MPKKEDAGAVATIKAGSLQVPIYQLSNGNYRAVFTEKGQRVQWHSKDLEKLKKRVRQKAKALRGDLPNLEELDDETLAAIKEVIRRGITVEDLGKVQTAARPHSVSQAVGVFLATREHGHSGRYLRTIGQHLRRFEKSFGKRQLHSIEPLEIDQWLRKQAENIRTRNNVRGSLVTMFRWCQRMEMLRDGQRTAAERVDRPRAKGVNKPSRPELYTPEELEKLLKAVPDRYVPWLAIQAFAGLRTAELFQEQRGIDRKEVLQWEDVHLEHEEPHIEVREEVSKNERRRIVPICPALKAWLAPLHGATGPVCPARAPWKKKYSDRPCVIDELEKALEGKWKKNALRHSFGTYRTAVLKNLPEVSLEMGNSIEMINRHYLNARTEGEGKKWFAITPAKVKRRLLGVAVA